MVRYGSARTASWAWAAFVLSAVPLAVFMAPYGTIPVAASLILLGAWVTVSRRFVVAIRSGQSHGRGKAMHVGAIITYTALNLTVIATALLA